MEVDAGQITLLLAELRGGDKSAEDRLASLVYRELHQMASRFVRGERAGHTLQPTALLHEAYMKLMGQDKEWRNRKHFFAVASAMMRRILVDYARTHRAQKRGGGNAPVEFSAYQDQLHSEQNDQILALDEALFRLSQLDERQCRVVEMRFFGGMAVEEIADVLDVSVRTVKRDWTTARAWLHAELSR